jgi:hypothetical protein
MNLIHLICRRTPPLALAAAALGASAAHADTPDVRMRFDHRFVLADASGHTITHEFSSPDALASSVFSQMGGAGKRVTGAPYSAEIVSERVQTLADGNQISRRTSQWAYRDSEGRTRLEQMDGAGRGSVTISDPVEGRRYVLNPARKSAFSLPMLNIDDLISKATRAAGKGLAGLNELSGETGVTYKDGELVIKSRGRDGEMRVRSFKVGEPGAKVIVQASGAPAGEGKRVEARVAEVVRFDGNDGLGGMLHDLLSPLASLGGIDVDRFVFKGDSRNTSTTPLGSRDIQGVRAEGKSTVTTLPAGSIGNRSPLTITSESWYAPELQITVLSRHSDPRYGETIYRVENLKRLEPSPDLFKVPSDYTLRGKTAMTVR